MEKLLEVKNLCVNFGTYGGEVKAVRGVTFDLHKGETLAIVGESGSGKSVACKTIMRILSSNGYIKDGQILFDGKDLTKISEKDMEKVRGKDIAMIFQDPMTSLNPTMTIGKQIMEPIIKHQGFNKEDAGKIIEYGTSDDIFYDPKHPYTWGLLGSMPTLDIGDNDLYNIPGTPPDLMDPPKGDAFALRSAYAMKIDHLAEPPMFKVSDTHYAATWLLHPLAPKIERPVNAGRKKVNINE